MNTILPLIYFALVGIAAGDVGYNYQQPKPVVNQAFRPSTPFANSPAIALAPPQVAQYIPPSNVVTGSPAQYAQPQFSAPGQFINSPSQYVPPFQQPPAYNSIGPAIPAPQYSEQQQRQTIISRNIYIHSAPEETEEISLDQGAEAAPLRKNYRILFVKAPTHNLRLNVNSIKQAQAANEEKTIIYVLAKKPDVASFQSQLSEIQTEPKAHKPEVYFIKYKTQAEANRAQQEIQAQYDALGGSTSISDEGFAPITSVIGGGPANAGSTGSISGASFSGGSFNGPSFSSSNYAQSASNVQQNFIQPSYQGIQGNQGAASTVSFSVAAPSSRYLPSKKK